MTQHNHPRPASPATRETVIDALVMTRLSDFAGVDMRAIEEAADRIIAALTEKGTE